MKLFVLASILSFVLILTGCMAASNENDGQIEDFQPAGQLEIHTEPSSDSDSETDGSSGGMSLASFYWENDAAKYQNGDANVDPNAFVNTDPEPISDQIEAVERAKNEVTIEYNATSEYYDAEAGMWLIDFHTLDWTDDRIPIISNSQKIYLDDDGITHLIVTEYMAYVAVDQSLTDLNGSQTVPFNLDSGYSYYRILVSNSSSGSYNITLTDASGSNQLKNSPIILSGGESRTMTNEHPASGMYYLTVTAQNDSALTGTVQIHLASSPDELE